MPQLIPSTGTPDREFKEHEGTVIAIAVFPDGRRMVTGPYDGTLRLWDLKTGVMLRKIEGHHNAVLAMAVSRDGKLIASGDKDGEVIPWHGQTGESLAQATAVHSDRIYTSDVSPDGTVLATGSSDRTTKLWNTQTWQVQGNPIKYRTVPTASLEFIMSRGLQSLPVFHSAFKQECSMLSLANRNAALAEHDYDRVIKLYSVVIDFNSAGDTILVKRSEAKLGRKIAMGGCTPRCAKDVMSST